MKNFDATEFATIEQVDGEYYVTIDPAVMYPAVIDRIRYCLDENVFPSELIQNRADEAGNPTISTDRATTLLRNARQLPDTAWYEALLHRQDFFGGKVYTTPDRRNIALYAKNLQADIQRVWERGDALEVALGWFLQALRCRIGGSNNTILAGENAGTDEQPIYHYQL